MTSRSAKRIEMLSAKTKLARMQQYVWGIVFGTVFFARDIVRLLRFAMMLCI